MPSSLPKPFHSNRRFDLHRPKPLSPNGKQKMVKAYARYEALDFNINVYRYKCNFDIPEDLGEIGAVLVKNEYNKKMFFKTIVLSNNVTFTCESWVASKFDNPDKRIFFTDKGIRSLGSVMWNSVNDSLSLSSNNKPISRITKVHNI
ncbi:hypothetical protein LXL04_017782 [Taraxacum kok-saghyz]